MKKKICISFFLALVMVLAVAFPVSGFSEITYVADDASNYMLVNTSSEKAEMVGINRETNELEYYSVLVNEPITRNGFVKKYWPGSDLNNVDINNLISPNAVIDGDTRQEITNTSITPYTGIALVKTTWYDSDDVIGIGTAWFVSENVLVTAAHNIYEYDDTTKDGDGVYYGWADTVTVIPGAITSDDYDLSTDELLYYDAPYGEYETEKYYSAKLWMVTGDRQCDYAVIILDNYSSPYYFPMIAPDNPITDGVAITGYSSTEIVNYQELLHLKKGVGSITEHNDPLLRHNIDTEHGTSGAPMYISGNIVYGIHTRGYERLGYNEGIVITEGRYETILGFVNENQ